MTTVVAGPVAKVVEPGPFTTIQDSGRFGYRRYGIPSSGALDIESLSAANRVLGNRPGLPALEIIQGPIVLSVVEEIALGRSGGSALVDGRAVRENPLRIRAGSTLSLEPGEDSTIVYLAFPGGLSVGEVMGSASTYTRAKMGGMDGRTLKSGDLLHSARRGEQRASPKVDVPEHPERHRVVRGPHADLLPSEIWQSFLHAEYRISFESDRMGYRLEGPALGGFRGLGRVLTLPVFPGMVQVTPDGLPIVLMADCQTTGGYPVIAVVVGPDICALAQKPPGAPVSFDEVTDEESQRIMESFSLSNGLAPGRD